MSGDFPMGDISGVVKVAAVQAASVFLDREGSTAKACRLIREAGRKGARVIGFPEGFIPAHPVWYHHHAATGAISNRLATTLFKNSVEIPGPETNALAAAASDARAYVVVGVCERIPNTFGTLFNSQIYFGPDGTLIGKHQKIMPTVGERLVHTGGFGDTFGAFQTEFGPMSGLICGENSNPLAVFALTAEGTRIHVMSWPNHFPVSGDPLRNRVAIDAQSFAQMSKAFVIAACGTVDEGMIEMLQAGPEGEKFLRDPDCSGGSCIVAPNSRIIAGPMGAEEGILYADCDLDIGIQMKLRHDFAGHYNRPDIFHLQINRAAPRLYSVHGDTDRALAGEAPSRLGSSQGGLLTSPNGNKDNGTA
jgi:aliphatic nitrilase